MTALHDTQGARCACLQILLQPYVSVSIDTCTYYHVPERGRMLTRQFLLLRTMDGQLDPVKQDMRNIQERIVRYEQKLSIAEQAGNKEEERKLFDMLLSLNNQLSGLQEEKNILLRSQAPSKPCLQLVHAGSHHVALHSVETRMGVYEMCINE